MLRFVSVALLISGAMVAVACASSHSGNDAAPCTAGNCGTCGNCESYCVCLTGDTVGCQKACFNANAGTGGGYPTGGAAGSGATGGGGGGAGGSGGTVATGDLATGLSISEVDLYQGVKITLLPTPSNNAPIVADREAVVRVFVTPDADYQPREIVARVEIGGGTPGQFDQKAYIGAASNEFDATSTLNVGIPPGALKQDATIHVSLREAAAGSSFPGSSANAQWDGGLLGVKSNGVFHVRIVPVVVNGITPITDAQAVAAYREHMMKLYAVADIDVQVRAPVTYSGTPPSYNGSGWGSMLNYLMQVRASDAPPSNVYYYGVVTPQQSFMQYCPGGCVAGLSNSTKNYPQDIQGRVGSGVGFFPQGPTPNTTETMAHEVGHTLGLDHAPCSQFGSIQGVDPTYPYPGAKIGVMGWDNVTKNFLDPNKYVDVMSYCEPTFIADWSYAKIYNRISYANGTGDMIVSDDPARAPGWFESAVIEDGKLVWGYPMKSPWPLLGEERQVDVLDAAGSPIGTVKGIYYPFSHGEGGNLYVKSTLLAKIPKGARLAPAGLGAALPWK